MSMFLDVLMQMLRWYLGCFHILGFRNVLWLPRFIVKNQKMSMKLFAHLACPLVLEPHQPLFETLYRSAHNFFRRENIRIFFEFDYFACYPEWNPVNY